MVKRTYIMMLALIALVLAGGWIASATAQSSGRRLPVFQHVAALQQPPVAPAVAIAALPVDSIEVKGRPVPGKPGATRILFNRPAGPGVEPFSQYVHLQRKLPLDVAAFEWAFHFSTPTIELYDGWGYANGKSPQFITPRLTAHGSGTEMVVEIDDSANVHRVYLLSAGSRATVNTRVPPEVPLTSARTFVEVNASYVVSPIYSLDDPTHAARKTWIDTYVDSENGP